MPAGGLALRRSGVSRSVVARIAWARAPGAGSAAAAVGLSTPGCRPKRPLSVAAVLTPAGGAGSLRPATTGPAAAAVPSGVGATCAKASGVWAATASARWPSAGATEAPSVRGQDPLRSAPTAAAPSRRGKGMRPWLGTASVVRSGAPRPRSEVLPLALGAERSRTLCTAAWEGPGSAATKEGGATATGTAMAAALMGTGAASASTARCGADSGASGRTSSIPWATAVMSSTAAERLAAPARPPGPAESSRPCSGNGANASLRPPAGVAPGCRAGAAGPVIAARVAACRPMGAEGARDVASSVSLAIAGSGCAEAGPVEWGAGSPPWSAVAVAICTALAPGPTPGAEAPAGAGSSGGPSERPPDVEVSMTGVQRWAPAGITPGSVGGLACAGSSPLLAAGSGSAGP